MKHIKSYIKFNEASEFISESDLNELLDKIVSSGIESLDDIERKHLTLFSEDDKSIIEIIEKMGDITNEFREVNKRMSNEESNIKRKKMMDNEWMPLNTKMRRLEKEIESYGIHLGDDRLWRLMRKQRPDAYNIIEIDQE